jgi:hypothetical protein
LSTARVASFFPASWYPGEGRPALGASLAMQSEMKRMR